MDFYRKMSGARRIGLAAVVASLAFGQTVPAPPAFEIAEVRASKVSPQTSNPRMSGGVLRGNRYDLRKATMVDLIRLAWSVSADSVIGGPAWLESDRFDVQTTVPPGTTLQTARLMLRTLLAERFQLVVHNDTRPMPAFVLGVGRGKVRMKEAEAGTSAGACKPAANPPAPPGLPPYSAISCHNVTMAAFGNILRPMASQYLADPVVDSTGLKGGWDFDLKWTVRSQLPQFGPDAITVFDAVEKQLGLKLEAAKAPAPVVVVDSVNRQPAPNPPGVTQRLPPPAPLEFEVADVRLSGPDVSFEGGGFMPGGRIDMHGYPLRTLIMMAWDMNSAAALGDVPKWMDSTTVDIVAKVSTTTDGPANSPEVDIDDLRVMLRALLADRFKLATHFEDRPVNAYVLVAGKPKLRKADPSNRTGCKSGPAPVKGEIGVGSPPPTQVVCQNISLAEFAARLQTLAPNYIRSPAFDATGIEGAWDFTLTFNPFLRGPGRTAVRSGDNGSTAGGTPTAGDPSGGVSIFDALNKQLGLKVETQKRALPVLVIDHIEERPTEN